MYLYFMVMTCDDFTLLLMISTDVQPLIKVGWFTGCRSVQRHTKSLNISWLTWTYTLIILYHLVCRALYSLLTIVYYTSCLMGIILCTQSLVLESGALFYSTVHARKLLLLHLSPGGTCAGLHTFLKRHLALFISCNCHHLLPSSPSHSCAWYRGENVPGR